MRRAVLDHAVRDADRVPGARELQHGDLRPGSMDVQTVDCQLRRAARLPERQRRRAKPAGRSVHAGPQFRGSAERPELEGCRSSVRRRVRPTSETARRPSRRALVAMWSRKATRLRVRSIRCSPRSTTRPERGPIRAARSTRSTTATSPIPPRTASSPGRSACGAIANPGFGQVQTRTTNYDPNLVIGWGVRPDNWEAQVSVQREIVPRVSVYAGYSRRWFGNTQVTTNRAVSNASYTAYSIPIPCRSAVAQQRRQRSAVCTTSTVRRRRTT